MRPINLLPPYIYDKQKKGQMAAVWGVLVLGVAGGFIYWLGLINADLDKAKSELTTAQGYQTQYNNLKQQIGAENNKISQIREKQEFIANAQKYNDSWRDVYITMRDVTSPDVILRRIVVDPGSRRALSFAGAARTEMDIVKWWMALRNDTARFESVRFELPPHGYNPAGGGQAGGGSFGTAGMGRGGGRLGGPGPGGGGMPGSFGPGAGGPPGGFSGGPGGAGAPGGGGRAFSGGPGGAGTPMMAGVGGTGGPGSFGSGGGSPFAGRAGGGPGGFGGGQSADVGPDILEGKPVINFTGVAILTQPLAGGIPTPAWPSGAGGGGGGGAPSSFGGPSSFGSSPGGGMPSAAGLSGSGGSPGGGSPGGGGGGSTSKALD